MPRRNLPFISDQTYHVFSRGNNRSDIFHTPDDYQRFLDKVFEYNQLYPVEIYSYCLISNHFHFCVKQLSDETPISKFFGVLLNSHSRYINIRYESVGHVFQSSFRAKHVDSEASFLQISRYIHLNPVKNLILKPGFIRKGSDRYLSSTIRQTLRTYPWSSYRYIFDPVETPKFLKAAPLFELAGGKKNYAAFVEAKITREDISGIDGLLSAPLQGPTPGVGTLR